MKQGRSFSKQNLAQLRRLGREEPRLAALYALTLRREGECDLAALLTEEMSWPERLNLELAVAEALDLEGVELVDLRRMPLLFRFGVLSEGQLLYVGQPDVLAIFIEQTIARYSAFYPLLEALYWKVETRPLAEDGVEDGEWRMENGEWSAGRTRLIVTTLPVGLIQTNCYVVGCEESREGVIIDPGGHPERILTEVKRLGLAIKYVLNTHAHFDHTDANGAIVQATGAPLAIHPQELPLLKMAGGAALFGLRADPSPPPDLELHDGDELAVGRLCFRVLHTPGHTPGHVCFYEAAEGVLFDGDVLFYGGIGRTDLPGGSFPRLMDSIRRVLLALPDETVVYSGHGPATTIGAEKRLNPWLR